MEEDQVTEAQVNIELSDEIAEGIYSNLAIIAHSHSEFVVDFIKMLPNLPKAKVKSRIILTPSHAKRLLSALADNVRKYEMQYGTIQEQTNQGGGYPPVNFTPAAQA
jgi:predicted transcriptional regulator